MRSKILKLIAVLAICFLIGGVLISCGEQGAQGETGATGAAGNGIASIVLSEDGTKFVITYTDGKVAEVATPAYGSTCECKNVDTLEWGGDRHSMLVDDETGDVSFVEGTYLEVCKDCGAGKVVKKVHHNLVATTIAPTCDTEGYTAQKCACGYEADKTDIVAPLDHITVDSDEYSDVIEAGKTVCEDGGYRIFVCGRDNNGEKCDNVSVVKVEPTGHKVAEWRINGAKKPTALAEGEVIGGCVDCGKELIISIPKLSETDYTYVVKTPTKAEALAAGKNACEMGRKGVYTYEGKFFEELAEDEVREIRYSGAEKFAFEIDVAAKGHEVKGTNLSEYEQMEIGGQTAYLKGQDGIVALNKDPKCLETTPGYVACTYCGVSVSITVYGEHEPVGEVLEEKNCVHGTKQHCSACDKDVYIDEALPHEMKYSIIQIEGQTGYWYEIKCAKCTTQNVPATEVDFDDLVELTELTVAPTCIKDGVKYFEEKTAAAGQEKKVYEMIVPKTGIHTLYVGGVAVQPDYIDESGATPVLYYNEAMYKKGGINLLNIADPTNIDLTTCEKEYDGFANCICGTRFSVKVKVAHKLELDKEDAAYEAATCIAGGNDVFKCVKEECPHYNETAGTYYREEKATEMLEHDLKYFAEFIEASETYTITAQCANYGTVCTERTVIATGLSKDDVTIVTVASTCTVQGTETITFIPGEGEEPIVCVNKLPLKPHTVAPGVTIDDLRDEDDNIVFDSRYFTALNVSGFVCQVEGEFDGYYTCIECNRPYSEVLVAEHNYKTVEVLLAPKCEETGSEKVKCQDCGHEDERVIPATGHSNYIFKEVNLDNGTFTAYCGVCKTEDFEKVFTFELSDDEDDCTVVKPNSATCTVGGYIRYTIDYKIEKNEFLYIFAEDTITVTFDVETPALDHDIDGDDVVVRFFEVEEIRYNVELLDKEGNPVLDENEQPIVYEKALCKVEYAAFYCERCGKYIRYMPYDKILEVIEEIVEEEEA